MIRRCFAFDKTDDKKSVLSGWGFKTNDIAEGYFGKEKFAKDLKVEIHPRASLIRNHDLREPIARFGVNMDIWQEGNKGLRFAVSSLPDTQLARETRELVKSGILSAVSVGIGDFK